MQSKMWLMAARILQLSLLARLPEAINRVPKYHLYPSAGTTPLLPAGEKLQVWRQVYSGPRMRRRGVPGPGRVLSLRRLGRLPPSAWPLRRRARGAYRHRPEKARAGLAQTLRVCGLRCCVARFFTRVDVTEEFSFLVIKRGSADLLFKVRGASSVTKSGAQDPQERVRRRFRSEAVSH